MVLPATQGATCPCTHAGWMGLCMQEPRWAAACYNAGMRTEQPQISVHEVSIESRELPRSSGSSERTSLPSGFELVRLVGSGGQGQVFKAIRTFDQATVAMKILRRISTPDDEAAVRFRLECEALSALSHPQIPQIVDQGRLATGELWYARDYVDGKPLHEHIDDLDQAQRAKAATGQGLTKSAGRTSARARLESTMRRLHRRFWPRRAADFPIQDVVSLFADICDVVEAANRSGIIHRDLKPSNILVDAKGRAHVLDFGIAKLAAGRERVHAPFDEKQGEPTRFEALGATRTNDGTPVPLDRRRVMDSVRPALTVTGQFLGSLHWSSPEQVEARPGRIDVRTDVYSIGVMLYQALSGHFPYEVTGSLAEAFHNIRFTEPAALCDEVEYVDRDLQAIVLKAITKKPDDRYASAGEFACDLRRYLDGQPVRARGDRRWYVVRKMLWKHRVAVGFITIFACLLVTFGWMLQASKRRRHLLDLSQAADIAFNVFQDSQNRPGWGQSAEQLAKLVTEQCESLLQFKESDPETQRVLAQALEQLSIVELTRRGPDRQSLISVCELRLDALKRRKAVATAFPENLDDQAAYSIALILVGDVANALGDSEHQQARYDEAFKIQQKLHEMQPENREYSEYLCYSFERLGALALDRGDLETAENYATRRLDLAKKLVDAEPRNDRLRAGLARAYAHLAEPAFRRGDDETAGRLCDLARMEFHKVAEDKPTHVGYQAEYASACVAAVDRANGTGSSQDVLQSLRDAVDKIVEWAKLEPDDVRFRGLLVQLARNVGNDILNDGGDEEYLRLIERIAEALAKLQGRDDPEVAGPMVELGLDLGRLQALIHLHRDDEFLPVVERLQERLHDLADRDDLPLLDRTTLVNLLTHERFPSLHDPAFALHVAQRCVELDPDSDMSHAALARALYANGRVTEACTAVEKAIRLAPANYPAIRFSYEKQLREWQAEAGIDSEANIEAP